MNTIAHIAKGIKARFMTDVPKLCIDFKHDKLIRIHNHRELFSVENVVLLNPDIIYKPIKYNFINPNL